MPAVGALYFCIRRLGYPAGAMGLLPLTQKQLYHALSRIYGGAYAQRTHRPWF